GQRFGHIGQVFICGVGLVSHIPREYFHKSSKMVGNSLSILRTGYQYIPCFFLRQVTIRKFNTSFPDPAGTYDNFRWMKAP
ncbi:MAG: hypothetical protein Q7J03_02555, partial [Methanoregula sp.]|nr:hypothetical protein [Methanoregula sp.]